MNPLHLIFALILAIAFPAVGVETEAVVLKALEDNGRTVNLEFVNPVNRAAVIDLLRDIATQKRRQFGAILADDVAAQMILLRLADPETVESAVSMYQKNYGTRTSYHIAEDLVWAEQAAIIPYIARDFFLNDGDKSTLRSTGDPIGIMAPPQSVFSGFTSLKIVAASNQFSAEMREWAKARRDAGIFPFANFREEMRGWWKQNEAAFKAGNYQAVKPPAPEQPPSLPNPDDSRRVIPPLPVVHSIPKTELPPQPAVPESVVANAEQPVRNSGSWWPWVTGIATLIVFLALALKQRFFSPRG